MVTNDETAATAEPTRVTNVRTFDGAELELEHPTGVEVFISFDRSTICFDRSKGIEPLAGSVYGKAILDGMEVRINTPCTIRNAETVALQMFGLLEQLALVRKPF